MSKTKSQVVKSPRIIYHEIKLSMKSESTQKSTLTTSYALHSLEPTKALFESEIIREETNNMPTILQKNFQKMKAKL